jgi:hypothetical protein
MRFALMRASAGEPPKTAAPAAAPVGEQPGPQNVMVLVAGADRLEPLDRALRYKRSEDTVFLVHGVELWNKLQALFVSCCSLFSVYLACLAISSFGHRC